MLNATNGVVARYRYDAWGKLISMTDASGAALGENTIGARNPLRYRGYIYDSETGFYYLQTRYYDPVVHRFINADALISIDKGYIGLNTYAYCNNDPVNTVDSSGKRYDVGDWKHENPEMRQMSFKYLNSNNRVGSSSNSFPKASNVLYNDSAGYIDTQKPPNSESGYVPPKKNPNPGKVKNPNGKGYGWPSNNGGVWIPDNNQDGGPGWTVQFSNGDHEHRYPDGHIRTHNFTGTQNDIGDVLIGGAIIVGAGIGIIFMMADDVTGIGAFDDAAIPALFGAFAKGVQFVAR